jgi:Holliday junction resolvase RusA-like endonuclease
MARNSFSFSVFGINPAPQGSKKYVGTRRTASGNNIPLIVESSAALPAWRKAVADAVQQAMTDSGDLSRFDGPVRVDAVFYMRKPRTVTRQYPQTPPDIDKICRSLLDAVTKGGVWVDDALVVELHAVKTWAVAEPGVIVTITAI